MNIFLDLFLSFAKIGLFTIGGGYAMLPMIESTCVEDKKWIDHNEMMNITVIAESTPGPVAVNCATFVGYKQKGIIGAAVATLGMVLPSFVIIYLIAMFIDNFLNISWVANAFKGMKLAVGILILDAAFKMIKKSDKKPFTWLLIISATLLVLAVNYFSLHISTVIMMLAAGFISLSVFFIRERTGKAGSKK